MSSPQSTNPELRDGSPSPAMTRLNSKQTMARIAVLMMALAAAITVVIHQRTGRRRT